MAGLSEEKTNSPFIQLPEQHSTFPSGHTNGLLEQNSLLKTMWLVTAALTSDRNTGKLRLFYNSIILVSIIMLL